MRRTGGKQRNTDWFRKWDVDGSGELTLEEFIDAIYSLGVVHVSYHDLAATFSYFDIDGSGQINYKELDKALLSLPRNRPQASPPPRKPKVHEDKPRPPTPPTPFGNIRSRPWHAAGVWQHAVRREMAGVHGEPAKPIGMSHASPWGHGLQLGRQRDPSDVWFEASKRLLDADYNSPWNWQWSNPIEYAHSGAASAPPALPPTLSWYPSPTAQPPPAQGDVWEGARARLLGGALAQSGGAGAGWHGHGQALYPTHYSPAHQHPSPLLQQRSQHTAHKLREAGIG